MDYLFNQGGLHEFILAIFMYITFRYFIIGLAFSWYINSKLNRIKHLKIQVKSTDLKIVKNEILFSMVTFILWSLSFSVIYYSYKNGYTSLYTNIHDHSTMYFIFSIILLFILHDFYFYWAHRLMHNKYIFRHVHKIHHKSYNTTHWSGFSFHPFEGFIEAFFILLVSIAIPLNPWAIAIFMFFMTLHVMLIHVGYEWHKKGFTSHPLKKFFITSTHHNMHHHFNRGNYGLYFTFWDKICGTIDKEYHNTYEEIFNRNPNEEANKLK